MTEPVLVFDNTGTPWLRHRKPDGEEWVLGFVGEQPMLRQLWRSGEFQTDLSQPNGFRTIVSDHTRSPLPVPDYPALEGF